MNHGEPAVIWSSKRVSDGRTKHAVQVHQCQLEQDNNRERITHWIGVRIGGYQNVETRKATRNLIALCHFQGSFFFVGWHFVNILPYNMI